MPIDQEINVVLKEMWRLDEKMSSGEKLTEAERDFYNQNLQVIQNYYENNTKYWNDKNTL